jgi:AraC-like DNA-binding protein
MKNEFLKRFFIIYFLFFACLAIVLVPAYLVLYNSYVKIYLQNNEQSLKNGLLDLEKDFSAFRDAGMSFFDTVDVSTAFFYYPPLSDVQLYRAGKADADFTKAMRYISSREDAGYILPGKIILSYNRLYIRSNDLYGKFLEYSGYETFDAWFGALTSFEGVFHLIPENEITNERRTYRGVTFVLRLPMNAKQNDHIMYMTVDSEVLSSKLLPHEILESGVLEITDQEGGVVLRRGDLSDARGRGYVYITAHSDICNITVRAGINNMVFQRQMKPFRNLNLIFIAAYVSIGIVCSFVFSWQSSKPLDSMARELSRQTGQIHYYMVSCVLNNHLYDENMQANAWAYLRPFIGNGYYRIGILDIERDKGGTNQTMAAEYTLAAALLKAAFTWNNRLITHLSQNTVVVIIPEDCRCVEPLEKTVKLIGETLRAVCRFYISGSSEGLENIPRSYARVRALSRLDGVNKTALVISAENLSAGDDRSAVFQDSQRLYELLIRGGEKAALAFLEEDRAHLIQSVQGDEELVKCLFYTYRYIFVRVKNDLRISELEGVPLPDYDPRLPIPDLFRRYKDIVSRYCEIIENKKSGVEKRREEEILSYINENISDPNMYIPSVTGRFRISENTLQRLVRNATGRSFFDYLDQKRLDMAFELIKTTENLLKDIMKTCGYTSQNTFYKAFKRRFNAAPSDIRKDLT